MIIERPNENIFDSAAQVLVNPVNCVGVMGKGLAKTFRLRYPRMFDSYQQAFFNGVLRIGYLHVFSASDGKKIINLPTKYHWRDFSNLGWIETGVDNLLKYCEEHKINNVAIPALGCGEGMLEWEDVKPIIYKYFDKSTIMVDLYPPHQKKKY
jgi:O-acetyl-ADP-ribose deacetylase (regulator of RNase III)